MPRGVYKRKRRRYARRIGEPVEAHQSLKELILELEGERVRHKVACDRLVERICKLVGFQ